MDQEKHLTRRQALKTVAGTSLLALLPVLPALADDKEQWTAAGKSADFPVNAPRRTALPGGAVLFITRLTPTTLSAVSAKCTHKGCEVGWIKADSQFECPCHGAAFKPDGQNAHGTKWHPEIALAPLPAIPVREKDGQVEVNLAAVPVAAVQPNHD